MTYIIVFLTVIVSIAALRNRTLFDRLSLVPYRVVHDRQWWRVITHGFVHGDYVHLAVNMFVLLSFGQFIERFFGAYQQIGLVSTSAGKAGFITAFYIVLVPVFGLFLGRRCALVIWHETQEICKQNHLFELRLDEDISGRLY